MTPMESQDVQQNIVLEDHEAIAEAYAKTVDTKAMASLP